MRLPLPSILHSLALLTLASTTVAQDGPLRARVAETYVELLPFEIQGMLGQELDRDEEQAAATILERLEGLLEQLPEEEQAACEEDHQAYFRQLVETHTPNRMVLVEEYERARYVSTTTYLLGVTRDALELSLSSFEKYPSTSDGLASLLSEGYLQEEMLTDAWGNALVYTNESSSETDDYLVISSGPDGERGTADDIRLGPTTGIVHSIARADSSSQTTRHRSPSPVAGDVLSSEPVRSDTEPAFATTTLLARVQPDEEPKSVIAGDAPSTTLVLLEGHQGLRVLRGGEQVALLPTDTEILASSTKGAFAYVADTDEGSFLHKGGRSVRLEDGYTEAVFLEGTDTLIYRDRDQWHCFDTGGTDIGEPTRGPLRRLRAFRERIGAEWYVHTAEAVYGPVAWASIPVLLDRGERRGDYINPERWDIAFRLWDGEATQIHVADEVWHCTWAGDPFVSADGTKVGALVNFGGRPAPNWEELREQRPLPPWQRKRRRPQTPAHEVFEGGTFTGMLNGTQGPDKARVLDPVFTRKSEALIYRARNHDGSWCAVVQKTDGALSTGSTERVAGVLVSPDTDSFGFDVVQDGVHRINCSSDPPVAHGPVLERAAGPGGSFAYIVGTEDGRRRLFRASSDSKLDWLSVPVDALELVGWAGPQPIAHGYSNGKVGFMHPGDPQLPFDGVTDPVFPDRDSDVQRFAHLGWIEDQCKLVVQDTARGNIHLLDHGGRVTGARAPVILDDGRIYFVCRLDGEEMPYPQYDLGTGGQTCLVVFDDGAWTVGPLTDHIYGIEVSAGGKLAYIASIGEQKRVETFAPNSIGLGELYDQVDGLEFRAEEPVYTGRRKGEGEALIIGDRVGPVGQGISHVTWLSDGTLAYELSLENGNRLVIGDQEFGPFDSISRLVERTDHGLVQCEVSEADWTRTALVLVRSHPDATGSRPSVRLAYDWLEYEYGDFDRSRLVYYAQRADRIERIELDLSAAAASLGL